MPKNSKSYFKKILKVPSESNLMISIVLLDSKKFIFMKISLPILYFINFI